MNNEPIKVNKSVIDIMNMPRSERRRIARKNGYSNIPSIVNVQVKKVESEEELKKLTDSGTINMNVNTINGK